MSFTDLDKNSLQTLEKVKPLYILPRENLAEEVLIPAFSLAEQAKIMVGFFSSKVLANLAPGLATFLKNSTQPLKLIISPFIRREDLTAIEEGLKTPDDIANELFEEILLTEDNLVQHTLKCFSHLIRVGRLDLKIALQKNALFHPKVWLFENGGKKKELENMSLSSRQTGLVG